MTATSGTHSELMRRSRKAKQPVPDNVDPTSWFVTVMIQERRTAVRREFTLGPLGSWSRARAVADQWEAVHGEDTAAVREVLPARLQRALPHDDRVAVREQQA